MLASLRPAKTYFLAVLCVMGLGQIARSQQLLPTYPGYDQYQKISGQESAGGPLFVSGQLSATWSADNKGFDYQLEGKIYHFDIASDKAIVTGDAPPAARGRGGPGAPAGAGRGRGAVPVIGGGGGIGNSDAIARNLANSANSPDGTKRAFSRGNNVFIANADGSNEIAVTSDGSTQTRILNGMPTIVYGEELGMAVGLWWSPDGKKVAYYRFDESKVEDYTVVKTQVGLYDTLEIDPYPKVGTESPVVDLYVYDTETGKSTRMDVRDGKTFARENLGYYVFRIAWTADSKEVLFTRMNRKQDTMELAAASAASGQSRMIVHEEWLANWVDWSPTFEYLPDHQRFIWSSERTGFKNYYLYDMTGKLLATLTHGDYEVAGLVKIDEAAGKLFYMARDGNNYLKLQLHCVNLDGTDDVRLTDPAYLHSVTISPDDQYFVDVIQTVDMGPATRLLDANGHQVAELAKSNMARFDSLGLKKTDLFNFKTYDGTAELQGILSFPSNFDPNKKYPLLVNVYGGPNTSGAKETFTPPPLLTEYGFLIASFDARSLAGRGRKFSDPFYHHLGIIEMDDQAAGVSALCQRPYVDKNNVGVYGTSYGGTSAATLLMRYPDIFKCADSSSPVTDYRNYNCVYAERNEGQIPENKAGYDAATVMTYVPNLKGRLLLYYGTADNNVHNSNALQLIAALQRAGKTFEVQVGPDLGHTAVNQGRMTEFFIENLVLKK